MIGANTTVSIYNIDHNASTNTYPTTPDLTGVDAYIESQDSAISEVLGQGHNIEVYQMFIDPCTIYVGDKVVDASNNEYRVAGIERHENNPDAPDMYKVILNKEAR